MRGQIYRPIDSLVGGSAVDQPTEVLFEGRLGSYSAQFSAARAPKQTQIAEEARSNAVCLYSLVCG